MLLNIIVCVCVCVDMIIIHIPHHFQHSKARMIAFMVLFEYRTAAAAAANKQKQQHSTKSNGP